MNLLTLFAEASAPGLAIMIYIYWRDKFDKEPLTLLIRCFFLGVISTGLTIVLSAAIDYLSSSEPDNYFLSNAIHAYLKVGLVEEFAKFILLYWFVYPSRHFDEPYDGITYSVMISMGFASFENVLYMIQAGHDVIYVRAFTAVPAHATFAIAMGYYVGLSKFSPFRWVYLLMGLLFAAFMHGTYDYFLFLNEVPYIALGALVSLILSIIWSLRAIKKHSELSRKSNEKESAEAQ